MLLCDMTTTADFPNQVSHSHVSVEEAAILAGTSARTILRWWKQGRIRSVKVYGRRWFCREDVARAVDHRTCEFDK